MSASSTGRWARWGWLATTFAMGVALLAASWSGHRRALQAASTLNRGQSDVLLEALRQSMRDVATDDEEAGFAAFLEDQRDAGLRFVGMYDGDSLIASAGTPVGQPPEPGPVFGRGGNPTLNPVGDRLRIITLGGRSRGPGDPVFRGGEPRRGDPSATGRRGAEGRRAPDATPSADSSVAGVIALETRRSGQTRAGGGRSGFAGRQPVMLAMEFEPVVARQLAAQSARTFGLAVLVTIVLLAAALLFWRLSVVHERAQLSFEHQRRLGALGEMSAVLAHEIRNPLASLKGHAQLLAGKLDDGSAERQKADRVVHEAMRLEALTRDLLDFTRAGTIERRAADPAQLLRDAAREVSPEGISVNDSGAPRQWSLDATRVRQALTNLLRNAQQAAPGDGSVESAVGVESGRLVFTVRDHGPGFVEDQALRIFEPFYTTRTHGTGLGLAVAKRVADLHDGSISAVNHSDGGAVFRLEIPQG